jgi:hypothetical protein
MSTAKATHKLTNAILDALNNKKTVGGIFCDLEKAFDCVNYNILLSKLEHYGVRGKFKDLLKSDFTDRFQRVLIYSKGDNHISYSEWGKVMNGVAQGSILGPLLFLFYINYLPRTMQNKAEPVLFADDTSIIVTNSCLTAFNNEISTVFVQLNEWFNKILLSLNYEKTHYIQFMTKNSISLDINIGLNNKFITNVSKTKFLGIVIESMLSRKAHIQQLTPKLYSACYAVRAIKPFISQDAVRLVYFSYFHSLMTYGVIIWGNSSDSVQVFRMQKRVVRILTGSSCRDSCRELFKTLKILPLQCQYIYIYIYIYIYALALFVVNNKGQYRETSEIHDKNTRSRSNLHLPLPNLSIYQRRT